MLPKPMYIPLTNNLVRASLGTTQAVNPVGAGIYTRESHTCCAAFSLATPHLG